MRLECLKGFSATNSIGNRVSDPGMHHGTCVMRVPWCMSGSLARGGGENFPGIPGASATSNFTYLARCPCGDTINNCRYQHTQTDCRNGKACSSSQIQLISFITIHFSHFRKVLIQFLTVSKLPPKWPSWITFSILIFGKLIYLWICVRERHRKGYKYSTLLKMHENQIILQVSVGSDNGLTRIPEHYMAQCWFINPNLGTFRKLHKGVTRAF